MHKVVGEFVAGLFDDPQLFYIGEVTEIANNKCHVNFMARLKNSNDLHWIFPTNSDHHWLSFDSILDVRPQIDLEHNLTSSRLVVMILHNNQIIRNMAK